MTEKERLNSLVRLVEDNPFAGKLDVSGANLTFLVRKATEHSQLKKECAQLKTTNLLLEAQIDRITMVFLSRKDTTVLQKYHDIQAILGVDSFV